MKIKSLHDACWKSRAEQGGIVRAIQQISLPHPSVSCRFMSAYRVVYGEPVRLARYSFIAFGCTSRYPQRRVSRT